MAVDLKSLVSKLNDPCRKALEAAAGLTMSRTNYNVEIEHWLLKILDVPDNDIAKIMGKYEADVIRANCQTRLTLRLADDETADTIAKRSPRVRVTRPTANRAMVMGGRSGQGLTVEDEDISLLEANLLQAQPAGQGFLRLDGSLYHINMPH